LSDIAPFGAAICFASQNVKEKSGQSRGFDRFCFYKCFLRRKKLPIEKKANLGDIDMR
jgi:hypothetical protein